MKLNGIIRTALEFTLPYRLMQFIQRERARRAVQTYVLDRGQELSRAGTQVPADQVPPFGYTEALDLVEKSGCDRLQLQEGSIPEASLDFIATYIAHTLGKGRLTGLHVGNFVGVSLCHLTAAIVRTNPASVMVSVDPNIPHRGIVNPAQKVISLINHFGLQKNSVVLTGYSLEKSISNDGNLYGTTYDPAANFGAEFSCECQLELLGRLAPHGFDFAVIDGNHEGVYLRREIAALDALLRPGGLLILDDVCWPEVGAVFRALPAGAYEQVATDGRVGVMRKSSIRPA